jgi:hypothetical protein
MLNTRRLLKKAFTPVTIMVIPHSDSRAWRIKLPSIGIFVSIFLSVAGAFYLFSMGVRAGEYEDMKQRLNYYASQFIELRTTISSLKKAESDFKKLFSFSSREKVLENLDTSDSGSLDMDNLKKEIKII